MLDFIPSYLLSPIIAGFLVAIMAGPLGCFVSWNRLSFYGHTLSHSALIGVALAVYLQVDVTYGVIFISIVFALLLALLHGEKSLARDTWMGIISYGSIAISLVLVSQIPEANSYLLVYLFGDILSIESKDLWILGGALIVSALGMAFLWKPLLKIAVHEGIAKAEGVPIALIRTCFMVLMALIVAVSIKVIGGLMITALLIIPAASARRLSRSPEQMAILSAIFGILSVLAGVRAAVYYDSPMGPTIVVMSLVLFLVMRVFIPRVRL